MKIFAIYFPQFYPIPLNSRVWGKNFTDWDSVKKSEPQYEGHPMPRIPKGKRYYRQDKKETIENQIQLASKYGITGFDFYHYWFDGELILEKPIELFTKINTSLEFCLTWANESWTKQWSGSTEMIIQQNHFFDEKIWTKHLQYLLKFFTNPFYLKIDGKPVFRIYRPELIPSLNPMMDFYDRYIKENSNLEGIYWMSTLSYDYSKRSNIEERFNDTLIFQPRYLFNEDIFKKRKIFKTLETYLRILPERFQKYFNFLNFIFKKGQTVEYSELIKKQKAIIIRYPEYYHSITVDWDNTARYHSRFTGVKNFNCNEFEEILKFVKSTYNKEILFINAWNEWAESAYLEPDILNGYQKLETINRVFKTPIND